jgi:arsenite-transporting ATPase
MTKEIETSMRDYFTAHPKLRFVFFGGKGGVGKTVSAGVTAQWLASQGKRTLLASTNPVHSLSGLLGQDVFGKHTAVPGVSNMWAYEIDTKDTIERSKVEIREKIQWFLKFADISTKADDFVESATMNPAFEESAMFENMIDLMFKGEYDVYVFDTAPTANARRLLGMSKVYSLWVNKMLKSREEARSLRECSRSPRKRSRSVDGLSAQFPRSDGHAQVLLTDDRQTAFRTRGAPATPITVIASSAVTVSKYSGGRRPAIDRTGRSSVADFVKPPGDAGSLWTTSGRSSTAWCAPKCRCTRTKCAVWSRWAAWDRRFLCKA